MSVVTPEQQAAAAMAAGMQTPEGMAGRGSFSYISMAKGGGGETSEETTL